MARCCRVANVEYMIRRTLTSLESRYYESRDDVDALLDLYINKRP